MLHFAYLDESDNDSAENAPDSVTQAARPILALLSGYSRSRREKKYMAFLQAFIDDSASDIGDRRLFLCGYLMPSNAWLLFSDAWERELKRGKPIEYFKMVEAFNLRGQFKGWSEEERDFKVDCLAGLIKIFEPFSFDFSASRCSFSTIIAPLSPRGLTKAHYGCSVLAMAQIARFSLEHCNGIPVDFIFDEQDGVSDDILLTFGKITKSFPKELRKCINGKPIYRNDKHVLPIQAADLLAWHIRREHEEGLPKYSSPRLSSKLIGKTHITNEISPAMMEAWARDFSIIKNQIATIQSKSQWSSFKKAQAAIMSGEARLPLLFVLREELIILRIKAHRAARRFWSFFKSM